MTTDTEEKAMASALVHVAVVVWACLRVLLVGQKGIGERGRAPVREGLSSCHATPPPSWIARGGVRG